MEAKLEEGGIEETVSQEFVPLQKESEEEAFSERCETNSHWLIHTLSFHG